MALKLYIHPQNTGKGWRGHFEDCKFTTNMGPSCECEYSQKTALVQSMKMLGWSQAKFSPLGTSFMRKYGDHFITVSRVISGWGYRWERGPGMTLLESGGFGTIGSCLTHFWGTMAERMDEYLATSIENSKLRNKKEA